MTYKYIDLFKLIKLFSIKFFLHYIVFLRLRQSVLKFLCHYKIVKLIISAMYNSFNLNNGD